MPYRILADAIVLVHLAFVLFVVLGGLLVVRWPRLAWVHAPAAVWGVAIEFTGRICPLTPLENWLRGLGGDSVYRGDFIARYVLPILYPDGLTRRGQLVLGTLALGITVALYWHAFARRR